MPAYRAVLADLSAPPDTSKLIRCDEREAADAIAAVTARLLRRRRALARLPGDARVLEPLVGSLRRLQNPALAAYRHRADMLLSEPFGAIASVVEAASERVTSQLLRDMLGRVPPRPLVSALAPFGESILHRVRNGGVRIVIVPHGRPFARVSAGVAALVPDIDSWPAPPAGLFVLSERLLLLRSRALRMTAAHEFAHALDAVMATHKDSYFSYESAELRRYFATAPGYVNEYAASGLDEFFAEGVRAYVEVNDERSTWLPLTRFDLHARDPRLFACIASLFSTLA